jgi:NADH:ubiquinone oxidoreductase subunit
MKEQRKNYESKERTKRSYLMSKTSEELSVDPKWHNFVQECINEHGYSWYYHTSQQRFGKYIKLNFSKKREN